MLIAAPSQSSLDALAAFPLALRQAVDQDEATIDFSEVSFTTPAWLALVGGALKGLKAEAPDTKRRAVNYRTMGYAAHMGFFQYFGLNYGLAPAEAPGSDTHVPLTRRSTADVVQAAHLAMTPVGEVIQSESTKLAAILSRYTPGDLQDTLAFSIREIVRNVVEHSGAETYTIAAQWWPARDRVEVVVTDHGCGLAKSLRENPKLGELTDEAALRHAILPGVSAKAWRKTRGRDDWKNSGYGLFMTQQLCAEGGEFALLSGETALCIAGGETIVRPTWWPGVAVILRLDTSRLADLGDRLAELRRQGVALEREIKGAARVGPSRASQTLHLTPPKEQR